MAAVWPLFLLIVLYSGGKPGPAEIARLLGKGDTPALSTALCRNRRAGKILFARLMRSFLHARKEGSEEEARLIAEKAALLARIFASSCLEPHLEAFLKEAQGWDLRAIKEKESVDRAFLKAEKLRREGAFEEALSALEGLEKRCAAIPYTKGHAAVLILRGKLLWGLGEARAAESALRRGYEVACSIKYRRYMAAALSALGSLCVRQGRFKEAESFFKQYEKIYEEIGDEAGISRALGNLAQVALEAGDLSKAGELYNKALSLSGRDKSQDSLLYLGLGRVASEKRNWREAFTAFAKAEACARTPYQKAKALTNLGALWAEQGDLKRAEKAYREAIDLLGGRPNDALRAALLNNTACLAQQEGRRAEARRNFTVALGVFRKLGDLRMTGRVLANLCVLAWEEGNAEEAEKRYGEARRALAGSHDRAVEAGLVCERGKRLAEAGRWEEAQKCFEEAASKWRLIRDYQGLALTFVGLGKAARALGRREDALRYFTQAVKALANQRGRLSRRLYHETFLSLTEAAEAFPLLAGELIERGRLREALRVSECAKAQGLLAALLSSSEAEKAVPEELKHKEALLRERQAALRAQLATAPPERYEELRKAFDANEAQYKLIEERIWSRLEPSAVDTASLVERALSKPLEGVAVAEYLVGAEESYLFFLSKKKLEVYKLPGEEELSKRVGELVEKLRDPFSRPLSPAASVGKLLLGSIAAQLEPGRLLLVIPDGPLCEIPFGVLRVGGRYFVEDHPVACMPSLSFAALSRRKPRGAGGSYVFGDPSYPAETVLDPRLGWGRIKPAPLTASRAEAEAIARLLGAKLYLGKEASEANLKKVVLGCRYLHLAVHAFVHREDPYLSCLLVAAGEGEDGVFELRELCGTRAELVVLSACESGGGRLARGEGLLGFGRAFLLAGARKLVVSLWPVNDLCAAQLMPAFWKHYRSGRSAPQALREAQLEFLSRARAGTLPAPSVAERGRFKRVRVKVDPAHPFFWGGFIVQLGEVPK